MFFCSFLLLDIYLKLSQITKFILDRCAKVTATLTSANFCRSPRVQRSLEIACKVTCKNASSDKKPHNFGSIQRVCKRLLRGTYRWGNLGSFLAIILHESAVWTQKSPPFQRKNKKWSNPEINVPEIREMFRRQAENGQRNERKDSNKVVVID